MQEEHNMMFYRAILDMDFSQNFNFGSVYRRAIQSAHWKNKTATLFTAVFRCLCTKTFHDITSILLEGDEVSYYEEDSKLYHYGVVGKNNMSNKTEDKVPVLLRYDTVHGVPAGKMHLIERTKLRRRKILTVPIIVISNDKHHDTAFVQHFLGKVFVEWFRGHGQYTNGITEVSIHSDGAASHFKNKESIGYLMKWKTLLDLQRVSWLFGCPGHGKGVWDGLGGIVKNGTTLHLIRLSKPVGEVFEIFEIIKNCLPMIILKI
jgi:hypothetical protein